MIKDTFQRFRQIILRILVTLFGKNFDIQENISLIIAPHPDDETFGCAGLIQQKALLGAKVIVIFMTRGENSLSDISSDEISSRRLDTAYHVCASLGVAQTLCLEFTDGSIPRRGNHDYDNALQKLLEVLDDINPHEVFCTHDAEGWSDHTAALELTYDALRQIGRPIALYKYWVWIWFSLPLRNIGALNFRQTLRLPISNEWPLKKSAINSYLRDQAEDGRPYCGILPKRFLSAFSWPYEVYERVEY